MDRAPAPIAPEKVRAALAPTLGRSRTLPAEAYRSGDVFAWERRHFFEGSWVCVGRTDGVANAGDQRAVRVGEEGILLVRGADGVLRGFYNTCRHRGHELLDARQRREVYYFGVFPNLLISLHPDYVMTHRMEPIGPTRTWIECSWLFPPEALEREGFSPTYATEFWDLTNREDWHACESVQRGLASRGSRQGPFAWSEDEVHAFMALVADGYLTGRATVPPQVRSAEAAAS